MTERARQNILGVFLGGLLALTVGAVWLFAAQRRAEVTALGQTLTAPNLGFAIRMPRGWEPVALGRTRLGTGVIYRQPPDSQAAFDSFTRRVPQRHIFFLAIPPNAPDEQVLNPLGNLVRSWDRNDNLFRYPEPKPFPLGPWRFSLGYERRDGAITFLNVRHGARSVLMRYQQIKADGRIFWCIMAGNTRLNEADKALLQAVASSFEFLGEKIEKTDQS